MQDRIRIFDINPYGLEDWHKPPNCPAFEKDWEMALSDKTINKVNAAGLIIDEEGDVVVATFKFRDTVDPNGWFGSNTKLKDIVALVKNPNHSISVHNEIGVRSTVCKIGDNIFAGDISSSQLVIARPVRGKHREELGWRIDYFFERIDESQIQYWNGRQ